MGLQVTTQAWACSATAFELVQLPDTLLSHVACVTLHQQCLCHACRTHELQQSFVSCLCHA
jgi:hypothetical protein